MLPLRSFTCVTKFTGVIYEEFTRAIYTDIYLQITCVIVRKYAHGGAIEFMLWGHLRFLPRS